MDASHLLHNAIREKQVIYLEEDVDEALERGKWAQAIELCHSIVAMKADHTAAHQSLALAQRQREIEVAFGAAVANCEAKRWMEAMADLEQVVKLDPDHVEARDLMVATARWLKLEDLYHQADQHLDSQEWGEALALLEQIKAQVDGYRDVDNLVDRARQQLQVGQLDAHEEEVWETARQHQSESPVLDTG
jgi:tetratricopeptide (TPR) repeat protein